MEETILIDCNHLQSAQFTGGNLNSNSYYTNKIGSGIQVNQGDKISVHQTYISEIGSDDNSIQIEDKFVRTKSFTYTKLTPHTFINGSNDKIMGYERITASNVIENIDTYNNKTNILYNYYITSNGENTFNLPRRYIYKPPNALNIDWNSTHDSKAIGAPYEPPGLVSDVGVAFNNNNVNMFYVEDDYFYFQNGQSAQSATNRLKQRYDNSRFTIFTLEETRYGSQTDDTLPDIVNGNLTSPAYLNYIEYIEKLEINLNSGFQSPEAIASNITNILKSQTQPDIGTLESSAVFTGTTNIKQYQPYNLEINSPTYHTFFVGSEGTLNEGKYDAWESATEDSGDSLDWLSSYQYIGIKRPQLWLKGRAFCNRIMEIYNNAFPNTAPNVHYAGMQTIYELRSDEFEKSNPVITSDRRHTIVTSIAWSDTTTILLLKDLLDEQEKHPECFLNRFNQYKGFTNINNSRFLHINLYGKATRKTQNASLEFTLGNDYLKDYTDGIPYLQSSPFFFDFNPLYKNKITDGSSWENGYLYGYFKKYTGANGFEYVSLTTDHLGFLDDNTLSASFTTLPNIYFLTNDGTFSGSIIGPTRFGWDASFNSYANLSVGLLSGWGYNPADSNSFNFQLPTAYSTTQLASYLYSRKLYMGANDPKLEYNTTSNRFEISKLHTSERVQNRFNAGAIIGTGDAAAEVKSFDTAGTEVYKINKRIYNNTYTPDLLPYQGNRKEALAIGTNPYDIDFKNQNIAGWAIFDSLSGIIIKDFGYNEDDWNKGFWETLGFDYIQFNSIETSDNDITSRVGNNNKNNLPYAFTNADVDQLATMDMITNIWGNGIYNLMLPQTMSFNVTNTGANQSNFFRENMKYEQFPAVTESANSIKLEAPRLPKKLQNPYYILKTDVLDSTPYLGGQDSGEPLNIIATIPKSNDYGDYFVSLDSGLEFTFTKPKLISSITTSIHNPNMSLANVNDSSSVIYKIIKQMNPNRFNIVGQIMEEEKNEKNKK